MSKLTCTVFALIIATAQISYADGPQDNSVDKVRAVPPVGIELSEEHKAKLQTRLDSLSDTISQLRIPKYKATHRHLPDVEVLHRAVAQALYHQEMFHERDIMAAHELLDMAEQRCVQMKQGKAPWTTQHGLVVRGYRSKLDGTVQPYGLEIAADYNFDHPSPVRCDIWFHGRGERSMELQFLAQRSKRNGPYPPAMGIILHPYGRYSNAFKFAGEVDTFEALENVKQSYNIDNERISVRGFSMGGAACWQFAVHNPDLWFAANPGAGFSETPEFLKFFQGETLNPPWYEEKLWRMYDCNLWAENLRHLPTVAYSGEIDKQKQAADLMETALKKYHIDLMHVIGPETAHSIHKESNKIIRSKFDALASRGRNRYPRSVRLTTFTLKYNQMKWITVHGLQEHWERSTIEAQVIGDYELLVETDGVSEFSVDFPAGTSLFGLQNNVNIIINGKAVSPQKTKSDLSFNARFHRDGTAWKVGPTPSKSKFLKRHDLQGPVDDALMQPFLFVMPTGKDKNPGVQKWIEDESDRARGEWRRHMRGDAPVKVDTQISESDMANYNLILWGTPESNSMIKKLGKQLPIQWGNQNIKVGDKNYASGNHIPILIYPNPLNPKRYIVFNSSFTYREYDYLNNARQTPKLPDWAIIDITTPPNARWPGKVVDANFFDENWELRSK